MPNSFFAHTLRVYRYLKDNNDKDKDISFTETKLSKELNLTRKTIRRINVLLLELGLIIRIRNKSKDVSYYKLK